MEWSADSPNANRPGWFMGCGTCGGNAWVKNAAVVRDKTCEQCEQAGLAGDDSTGVLDSLVSTELGWCGCGSPDRVDEMMLAYLRWVAVEECPRAESGVHEDAVLLLAYIADKLGWTEHGGSVLSAWLTEDGKQAMANLAAAYSAGCE